MKDQGAGRAEEGRRDEGGESRDRVETAIDRSGPDAGLARVVPAVSRPGMGSDYSVQVLPGVAYDGLWGSAARR